MTLSTTQNPTQTNGTVPTKHNSSQNNSTNHIYIPTENNDTSHTQPKAMVLTIKNPTQNNGTNYTKPNPEQWYQLYKTQPSAMVPTIQNPTQRNGTSYTIQPKPDKGCQPYKNHTVMSPAGVQALTQMMSQRFPEKRPRPRRPQAAEISSGKEKSVIKAAQIIVRLSRRNMEKEEKGKKKITRGTSFSDVANEFNTSFELVFGQEHRLSWPRPGLSE